jgi:hypothetical protein
LADPKQSLGRHQSTILPPEKGNSSKNVDHSQEAIACVRCLSMVRSPQQSEHQVLYPLSSVIQILEAETMRKDVDYSRHDCRLSVFFGRDT